MWEHTFACSMFCFDLLISVHEVTLLSLMSKLDLMDS